MIDADTARRLLAYDPETGVLTWREREVVTHHDKAFNTRFAGKATGCPATYKGGLVYLQVHVLGKLYFAHRVIWLMLHGVWPKADVDHRDGDGTNNRKANLRDAERFENNQNVGVSSRNTSGLPGVSQYKQTNRWRAQISHRGRNKCLGYFDTREAAGQAYLDAKARLHTFNPEVRG